ncbi:hypothetical protein [Phenylobacterium sp.]|uniref:hypothetical protein n=1 Tax=Phenylobacterium sp. TaxID=1871053 RepID=UPI002632E270|nr:hypothetical protein [Phenylobacterium sp.]
MEEWARLQNIRHFERDLEQETDPEKRRRLAQFIADERARLAEAKRGNRAKPAAEDVKPAP